MSLPRGPTRIVLLRGGGYDYAELELHAPVHLVAANNVGKTSLIAALQFLYIDDMRQMHFSHGGSETRKHYFPHAGSAVLFECMTPTGLRVFGLRGLGPVQGHKYERFAYSGPYDRADYLDGRQLRPWDEVTRRIVGRDLAILKPRDLRSSLTGAGDATNPPLGLVPLKRSGSYESFRFLFRNLLRLSRIEQHQLKKLFIDITRPRLRQVEVDLRRDYAELFARVERESEGVTALQRVAESIAKLVRAHDERESLRGRLARAWSQIESMLAEEQERVQHARSALGERRLGLASDISQSKEALQGVRDEASKLDRELGALETEIERMQSLRKRTASFAPDLEEGIRSELSKRRDDLASRIALATRTERRDAEQELGETKRAIERDTVLVAQFADAVVTWLRTNSGLSDAELDVVFGVLNPALLGAVIGDGQVEVRDVEAAVAALRAIHDATSEDGFIGAGVLVPCAILTRDSPLARIQDVESVRSRLQAARRKEPELKQVLDDIRVRDELASKKTTIETDLRAAEQRLGEWDEWQRTEPRLAGAVDRAEDLDRQDRPDRVEMDRLQGRLTELEVELHKLDAKDLALGNGLREKVDEVRRLEPCPPSWASAANGSEGGSAELADVLGLYRDESREQRRTAARVERLLGDVEHATAARYVGADERETIDRLKDELAALQNRQRAVQDLWTSLIDGMRSAFKSLVEGVDEIRREVSLLTRALGRRQISNLERVELEVVRQHDLLRKLDAVIGAEDAPLFAGPDGRSKAAREIASWLEDRPRIELAELFDLRFKVVDQAGNTKTFDSLSQIESQGTSTTIKVLVHLELLMTMLSDDSVAVPFFLDEVATLDADNLRGLIDHASAMGFVPVVASPEARDCVDTLYFLRPSDEGLVLDEKSRVVLHRERPDGD